MQPGTFVMTKLTPGEPPPPEASSTLEMFMEMDLEAMALDNYQIMGLGRCCSAPSREVQGALGCHCQWKAERNRRDRIDPPESKVIITKSSW